MFLLGLVLLGLSGVFTGLLVADNWGGGPDYTVTLFGNTLGTLSSLEIFLAGIALTLVFCFGMALMSAGARRARRRSVARRTALREAQQARAERDELAARLDGAHEEIREPVVEETPEETPAEVREGARTGSEL
jgi:membrane protein DedA with SNARE-associated domain